MFGLGAGEIFLILAFALIFIGPKKLPELARSLGKGVREFQNAKDELLNQVQQGADDANNDDDEQKLIAENDINPKDEIPVVAAEGEVVPEDTAESQPEKTSQKDQDKA